MKRRIILIVTAALLALVPPAAGGPRAGTAAASEKVLVTFGDSLTSAGAWPGELAAAMNMRLVNAGVSGDITPKARERFKQDVLDKNPNVVIIAFGTNDFMRTSENGSRVPLEEFRSHMERFAREARAAGARPVLLTCPYLESTIWFDHFHDEYGGFLAVLDTYNDAIRSVARETGALLVDIRKACDQHDMKQFLAKDGIHLGDAGNRVYAEMIAEALAASAGVAARPTKSTIALDGQTVDFEAYNIKGENYIKLRDLACALNGSEKRFAVRYFDKTKVIALTTGQTYRPVGGELAKGDGKEKTARPAAPVIYLNGKPMDFTAYNIGDNNYIKLREIAGALDLGVDYDAKTNRVAINTGNKV